MNKRLSVLCALTIMLISLPLVSAAVDIDASVLRYEPLPAQPGQYVTVYVQIQNNGFDDAPDAAIRIEDQFPFSTRGTGSIQKDIGLLKGQQSKVFEFELAVDPLAPIGANQLLIDVTSDKVSNAWMTVRESLTINSNDASLSIVNVQTTPDELISGSSATIDLTLKNTADLNARNINIKLALNDANGKDLPFIPDSVLQRQVFLLQPDQSTPVTFVLKTYPSAKPGYYKVPVTTTFYTDKGELITQDDTLGIVIKAQPELDVFVESSTLAKADAVGKVNLQFVNKGVNDLKFLEVNVLSGEGYELVSQPRRYIGDLDSDDYRSEEYNLKLTDDNATLLVDVSYKDDNNILYETVMRVPVSCCKYDDTKKNGPSGFLIFVVLVAISFIGYRFYKKRKQKKHDAHHLHHTK
ncbi:MAG: COG1361 S-layer family protein [Candidatus Woesearchaeota archaeon]